MLLVSMNFQELVEIIFLQGGFWIELFWPAVQLFLPISIGILWDKNSMIMYIYIYVLHKLMDDDVFLTTSTLKKKSMSL